MIKIMPNMPASGFLRMLCLAFASISLLCGCGESQHSERTERPAQAASEAIPERIVSTAPSVTETLFAVGAGDRVVGVSRFCCYPPEVEQLPKVGGLFDPDVERIVELRPDLVLMTQDNAGLKERLAPFDVRVETLDQSDLGKLLDALEQTGALCGPETRARGRALKAELAERIAAVEQRTASSAPVSVLIAIDRERGSGRISNVFVAGNNRYFNEILRVCGGRNVFENALNAVPTVSAEAILEANPAVIIDLATDGFDDPAKAEAAIKDWRSLPMLDAVKNDRVYSITSPEATIPGPRVLKLIEHLAELLHPAK